MWCLVPAWRPVQGQAVQRGGTSPAGALQWALCSSLKQYLPPASLGRQQTKPVLISQMNLHSIFIVGSVSIKIGGEAALSAHSLASGRLLTGFRGLRASCGVPGIGKWDRGWRSFLTCPHLSRCPGGGLLSVPGPWLPLSAVGGGVQKHILGCLHKPLKVLLVPPNSSGGVDTDGEPEWTKVLVEDGNANANALRL